MVLNKYIINILNNLSININMEQTYYNKYFKYILELQFLNTIIDDKSSISIITNSRSDSISPQRYFPGSDSISPQRYFPNSDSISPQRYFPDSMSYSITQPISYPRPISPQRSRPIRSLSYVPLIKLRPLLRETLSPK